jgi:lipopolysaccharide/colanic/teichoic acid biosynthesis glycosyltransferase
VTFRLYKDCFVRLADVTEKTSRRVILPSAKAAAGVYPRQSKRMFDAFVSATALLLLSPLFVVVSLLIKLTSPGPVFFLQQRVGREGKLFKIAKFRSMRDGAEQQGPAITAYGDLRITSFGRILRFSKIDELPQLWNVLKGEMSLVGPRPELPRYVAHYTAGQRRVLSVRPGMTDPASIKYAREEHELGQKADPERYYVHVILPDKLDLNLQYVERITLLRDLFLLSKTVITVSFP